MARDIAAFDPSQARRIWNATQIVERGSALEPPTSRVRNPGGIYFRNDSGHTIPSYGCFQASGTVEDLNQNYITAIRPISWTGAVVGPFFFNGPREVEDGAFGTAQNGPVYRAIKDSTTLSVGMRLGPVSGSFEMGKGCLYSYIGEDDVAIDCIKIISNETPLLAITDSGGIGASTSGTVTARVPGAGSWSSGTVTYTAWNPTATAIGASKNVILFPENAKWCALEICP